MSTQSQNETRCADFKIWFDYSKEKKTFFTKPSLIHQIPPLPPPTPPPFLEPDGYNKDEKLPLPLSSPYLIVTIWSILPT